MEPQWVDRDSLVKIWQRQRRLPWTILETARCVVREFVPEDLEAIRALYDEEAERFLEAPSEDTEKERKILEAYIDRVYRLCGYGHWAVISRQTGELIGRIGFSYRPGGLRGAYRVRLFAARIRADRGRRGALQHRFSQNIAIFWLQRGSAQGRSALLYTEQKRMDLHFIEDIQRRNLT